MGRLLEPTSFLHTVNHLLVTFLKCATIVTKCFLQVNFVGKLLGPQGSTIKRLQEETGAKISVLGKGSMRDKNKVCFFCFFFLFR